jgi:hypothetical protein
MRCIRTRLPSLCPTKALGEGRGLPGDNVRQIGRITDSVTHPAEVQLDRVPGYPGKRENITTESFETVQVHRRSLLWIRLRP